MTARPLSLYRILESNSQLLELLRRAEKSHRSIERVRGALPPDLAKHVKDARFEEGRLVLLTDSPVWASRLRYAAPGLRAALDYAKEISVKVLPSGFTAPPRRPRPPSAKSLSRENAEQIRVIASAIADPQLSQALMRLANHGEGVLE